MKELKFSKTYCNAYLFFYSCLFVLETFLLIYFLYYVITARNISAIGFGVLAAIIFFLAARAALTDIVFFARFYGLTVKPLNDKLVLSTDNRECQIPATKDVNVIYCMMGWLIIWPSENKNEMILLRKGFFGKTSPELRDYFELNMNNVSTKEEKQKTLKLFHVNVFFPLRYMKWPVLCINSN